MGSSHCSWCWLFPHPLLGLAVQLGTPWQGWAHTLVPRTHFLYFCHCAQTGAQHRLAPAGSPETLLQESKPTASCKAISFWLCPRPN